MVIDLHRLRDPRFIKIAVISTAVIAVSVGVGLTVAGTRNAPASSLEVNGGIGAVSQSSTNNKGAQEVSSYLTNSDVDHLDTIDEITDESQSAEELINGYSLYGVERVSEKSVKTIKCGGEEVSVEESSSKSGKESGGRRRLGWNGGWGQPITSSVSTASKSVKTEISTSTSNAKSVKTEVSSSVSSAKSVKTEISSVTSSAKSAKQGEIIEGASSWGASWDNVDVDCDTTTVVTVSGKASNIKVASAKALKAKSSKTSKVTVTSSAKSTKTTTVTTSDVWGSTVTVSSSAPSPAKSTNIRTFDAWTSSPEAPVIESIPTSSPTLCTERNWYFNEEKCTNDGNNMNEKDEYYDMLTCCEENGMTAECVYEDVCVTAAPTAAPTPKPTTLAPVTPEIVTDEPTPCPSVEYVTTDAPTPCTGRKWYYDEEKCTNDGNNVNEKDEYDDMLACCEENGMTAECVYEDVCVTAAPTAAPTPKPTTLAPVTPEIVTDEPTPCPSVEYVTTDAPTPCIGRKWYYDEEKCINDGNNVNEKDEYDDMLACCEENGMTAECVYEDVCVTAVPTAAPTPKPTTLAPVTPEIVTYEPTTTVPTSEAPTTEAPSTETPTAVPEVITEEPTTAEPTSLAPTSASPTITFVITGEPTTAMPVTSEPTSASPTLVPEIISEAPTTPSPVTEEPSVPLIITSEPSPAPTPCEGRQWYALSTQGAFVCSNGYDIPVDVVDFTFFNTLDECCLEIFGEGVECDYTDVCVETVETYAPSPMPSFGSTPTVSKETTGPPTFSIDRTSGNQ